MVMDVFFTMKHGFHTSRVWPSVETTILDTENEFNYYGDRGSKK